MRAYRIAKWSIPFGVIVAVALSAVAWQYRVTPPEEQFAQALAAIKDGDLDRVSEIALELEGHPQFQQHTHLLRGAVLLRDGKLRSAFKELSLVPAKGELRVPVLELTAECLHHMGRFSDAIVLMRQLADENPDHVDAHRWLGVIYYDLGANDLAIPELKIVARLAPKDYGPHRLLGLIYFDFEQYPQAIQHYRKALALSPPRYYRKSIVRKLAKSLISKRDFKTALSVLADMPPDALLLALQSECYWSLGQSERAKNMLHKAGLINPDERDVLFLQARMLLGDGRREQAIVPLKRVLRRNPLDPQCRYQLALVYRQLGRPKEYEREIAKWNEAQKLWKRLTKLNIQAIRQPGDASVLDELAEICQKLGKQKLSRMWKQAANASRQSSADRKRAQPRSSPGKRSP